MKRDERDEWPDHERRPGMFDITASYGVEGYPGVTARLEFICPNGKHCCVLLAPRPIPATSDERLSVWGWNGDKQRPTLKPSINCVAVKNGKPTGGCGWHGFITDGVMK